MIEIQNLTKQYKDVTAVKDLNLHIAKGELFALLGVNGAGKTTTIKMLSCLAQPTEGDALIGGHSIRREPQSVKELLGISPQETAVGPNLSVRENLELSCGIGGHDRAYAERKTTELLQSFSLQEVAEKRARKLSGGYQRRLSIAMALASEPQVLYLDEPTLGLDVLARRELWKSIRALKGRITIILTTHYLEEAEALADRIGIMSRGQLIALGTADELKTQTGAASLEDAFVALCEEGGTEE